MAWRIDRPRISLDVRIPPNTTAEVHVPTADAGTARTAGVAMTGRTAEAAVFHVGSGRYAFEAASPI